MGKHVAEQCTPDEFANALEGLFAGNPMEPQPPLVLDEPPWALHELDRAIKALKTGKAADDGGLVAELLKNSSDEMLLALVSLYNQVLFTGDVPPSWHKTLFTMLPKKVVAKIVTDFRPIASLRLLYKTFAHMILHRIEPLLDARQPEEQHGFRSCYRIEEHILSASMVIDKMFRCNRPVWIVSLDLSKAFDRVDWNALWGALREHGVSDHLVWLLQCLYHRQTGEVRGSSGNSRTFGIHSGVRQACVLSPRLFSSALQWAMATWRITVECYGIDLGMVSQHFWTYDLLTTFYCSGFARTTLLGCLMN